LKRKVFPDKDYATLGDYEGQLLIDNISMEKKTEKELARIRNEKIGFVFQFITC
jgi:ABC-type lipoprotein export system ATPase subunit